MRPVPTAAGRWPPFGRNAGPASNRKPGRFHRGTLDRFPIGISGRFESEFAVKAALIVKKLAAYPKQNGLALALREIGRIERTLGALDWICDPDMRRETTEELNKGESRNALARAVSFHRLGRFRDRSHENHLHRAAALNLVTAAIVLWNTRYLGRALDHRIQVGERFDERVLRHLSPLGWEHINLTGDYIWSPDITRSADGLRPLILSP